MGKEELPLLLFKETMILLDQGPGPDINHNYFFLEALSGHRAILGVRVPVGSGIRPDISPNSGFLYWQRFSKANEDWKKYLLAFC